MKANEAPDKIYLTKLMLFAAPTISSSDNDIEYIRTDAFIEKAMKFLYDYNKNMVKKHGARAVLGCSEFTINVDEFEKYMEGE